MSGRTLATTSASGKPQLPPSLPIPLILLSTSINDYKPTAERPFVLGLPTGSSPIPVYKHLIKLVKEQKLSCVSTFSGRENHF